MHVYIIHGTTRWEDIEILRWNVHPEHRFPLRAANRERDIYIWRESDVRRQTRILLWPRMQSTVPFRTMLISISFPRIHLFPRLDFVSDDTIVRFEYTSEHTWQSMYMNHARNHLVYFESHHCSSFFTFHTPKFIPIPTVFFANHKAKICLDMWNY